jgi:superfamily I DNA and/or RNA helicase
MACRSLLSGVPIKSLIVEEAAEVLEAHVLASLSPSMKHLVMIGDHLQLRPKIETYTLQVSN